MQTLGAYALLEPRRGEPDGCFVARQVMPKDVGGPVEVNRLGVVGPERLQAILADAKLRATLCHPQLLQTLEVFSAQGEVVVVSEQQAGFSLGALLQVLQEHSRRMTLRLAVAAVAQVAEVMQELEGGDSPLGIDALAPEQVRVRPDGRTVLAPSLWEVLADHKAPELRSGKGVNSATRVWVLGRLLRGMLAHSFAKGAKPKVPAKLAKQLKPLLVEFLASSPERRPSLAQALEALQEVLQLTAKGTPQEVLQERLAFLVPDQPDEAAFQALHGHALEQMRTSLKSKGSAAGVDTLYPSDDDGFGEPTLMQTGIMQMTPAMNVLSKVVSRPNLAPPDASLEDLQADDSDVDESVDQSIDGLDLDLDAIARATIDDPLDASDALDDEDDDDAVAARAAAALRDVLGDNPFGEASLTTPATTPTLSSDSSDEVGVDDLLGDDLPLGDDDSFSPTATVVTDLAHSASSSAEPTELGVKRQPSSSDDGLADLGLGDADDVAPSTVVAAPGGFVSDATQVSDLGSALSDELDDNNASSGGFSDQSLSNESYSDESFSAESDVFSAPPPTKGERPGAPGVGVEGLSLDDLASLSGDGEAAEEHTQYSPPPTVELSPPPPAAEPAAPAPAPPAADEEERTQFLPPTPPPPAPEPPQTPVPRSPLPGGATPAAGGDAHEATEFLDVAQQQPPAAAPAAAPVVEADADRTEFLTADDIQRRLATPPPAQDPAMRPPAAAAAAPRREDPSHRPPSAPGQRAPQRREDPAHRPPSAPGQRAPQRREDPRMRPPSDPAVRAPFAPDPSARPPMPTPSGGFANVPHSDPAMRPPMAIPEPAAPAGGESTEFLDRDQLPPLPPPAHQAPPKLPTGNLQVLPAKNAAAAPLRLPTSAIAPIHVEAESDRTEMLGPEEAAKLLAAPTRKAGRHETSSLDLGVFQQSHQQATSAPTPAEQGLVVYAPVGGTVFVDGRWRGVGTVVVADVPLGVEVDVRVACPGYLPWVGTVTVHPGQPTRVQPQLQPRGRE
jgi:hypothetical protein